MAPSHREDRAMSSNLPALLALAILLGLLHVLLAASLVTRTRGLRWNIGNRDEEGAPVPAVAARAQRASRNFLETFPFFAAALLCAMITQRDGGVAVLGAQLYFWARVAYLPIYVIGIPVIRSLVWAVSLVGILMMVAVLL
jgi:uncharacterized MAPEG superfamily protein